MIVPAVAEFDSYGIGAITKHFRYVVSGVQDTAVVAGECWFKHSVSHFGSVDIHSIETGSSYVCPGLDDTAMRLEFLAEAGGRFEILVVIV